MKKIEMLKESLARWLASEDSIEELLLFLFSMLCGALTVVLHEVGHYLVAAYFGYSPVLHYASVFFAATPTPFENVVFNLAGVSITLIAALVSLLLMYVTRCDAFVSLGMSMSIRNVVVLPLILLGHQAEEGIIGYKIVLIVDLIIIYLLIKLSKHRIRTLAATLTGGMLGGILWLFLIGPALLP